MRFEEFSRRTGWNATRTSRAVKTGLFRDKTEQGSGNAYEYTERDVLMARLTDQVRESVEDSYGTVLLSAISAAIYGREDVTEYLVVHPPVAHFVDSAEQAACLVCAEGGTNVFVIKLAEPQQEEQQDG